MSTVTEIAQEESGKVTMATARLFKPDRMLAFSDGVIAIAITLLVLGLEVPSIHEVPEGELPEYLVSSAHALLSYVISFVVIGTYWLEHYVIFHYVERVNRPFVLLNGLFLLCVSFMPFPTGLQAVYRFDELAVVLYGCTNFVCGLTLVAMWVYATKRHRLVAADLPQEIVTSMTRRVALAPAICLLAIVISPFNIVLSKLIFLAIPLFYFAHRTVDEAGQDSSNED